MELKSVLVTSGTSEEELPDEDHEHSECGHPAEQDPLVARNSLLNQPHDRLRHSSVFLMSKFFVRMLLRKSP